MPGVAPVLLAAHGAQVHLHLTWFQTVVLGVLQGVSELFPVSSLGHIVLLPSLFGWHQVVTVQSDPESPWLAFVVMLHVGSALGLLVYFWRDWVAIITAWLHTLVTRKIETPYERLAWLIIAGSIPAGIIGLAFEHPLRVALAKPESAALFLILNGGILLGAERMRRRSRRSGPSPSAKGPRPTADAGSTRSTTERRGWSAWPSRPHSSRGSAGRACA